jgi:3-phosphoshikimate 1-carboxyvinyltransferase
MDGRPRAPLPPRNDAVTDLLEIVPLTAPVRAEVTVPGSKSLTNRALVLAALAEGETTLRGALWSEDTQVMVECLQELGFMVNVAPEAKEPCNRTLTVYGLGGKVPRGGTSRRPLELFVGNAGTAARFLGAMLCLGDGAYRLHGVPRMHERPQAGLFAALRALGYEITSADDKLPAVIHGAGPKPGICRVSVAESSQFASALLLGARTGGWKVEVTEPNADELPYVEMTRQLCQRFPVRGGVFEVEPDASSGSYFWAVGMFDLIRTWKPRLALPPYTPAERAGERVGELAGQFPIRVAHWPQSHWQADAIFPLWMMNTTVSRRFHLGDSIMTAMMVAPFAQEPTRFTDLGRLRLQECERVAALRTELTRCGAKVVETGDTLEVFPSRLRGAEIETYHDHRMAMCFATLGLKVPGLRLRNPACVKKTFPDFFQKLVTPPPAGLGATLRDAATGRALRREELLAD